MRALGEARRFRNLKLGGGRLRRRNVDDIADGRPVARALLHGANPEIADDVRCHGGDSNNPNRADHHENQPHVGVLPP
jgi:hypothetical protein